MYSLLLLTLYRLIEDFQDPRESATFIEHIKAGLRLLSENEDSLLVLSGFAIDLRER